MTTTDAPAETTTPLTGGRYQPPPITVRLFDSEGLKLPCSERAELFFDPRASKKTKRWCASCPFLGRCSYNAVAAGATHGIWGGIVLPGSYPGRLQPVYARLAAQFEQRRIREIGDVAVAPLPNLEPTPDEDEDEARKALVGVAA